MKRFFTLFLVVSFLVLAFDFQAFALFGEPDPDGYAGAFGYNRIASGKEAEIIGYYGLTGGEETIPETVDGLPITSIKVSGIHCEDDSQITVLHLPSTLKSFSADSLQNCHGLKEVTIAEDNPYFTVQDGLVLTADGTKVVLCPAATEQKVIKIPDGVSTIGVQAFADCVNVERVIFPTTLEVIESGANSGQNRGAFENCVSLQKLRFPMGITTIGNYAFFGCTSLNEVIFLDDVSVSVGIDAFFGCTNLSSVLLFSGVSPISVESFGYLPGLDDPSETYRVDGFTLYGINATAAKTYATQNSFDFGAISVTTDFMNDVKVSGYIPNLGGLSASQVSSGADLDALCAYFDPETPANLYRYQISGKKGATVTEPFTIKAHYCAPLPQNLSEDGLYVFRMEDGKPEYLDSDCYFGTDWLGDPIDEEYVYFEADTAGLFAFVNGGSVPGHIRGEEGIDLSDLTLLAKYIAGWNVAPRILNSDVTGDGLIEISDLTLLAKYIAGWDVTLAPFASSCRV